MSTLFEMIGAAFVLVMGLMSILWVIYFFRKNSGIVDIGWALSFVLIVWAYFFLGDGAFLRSFVLALMVTIWGLRLAYFLFDRYRLNEEDPRYAEIRLRWGEENSDFKFFLMFLFQGLLALILSIPFLIVCRDTDTPWPATDFWGFAIWAFGLAGEAIADKQLADFRDHPGNQGKICQEGLWRYSRHPNYFFEWIVWVGYFLYAVSSPWGWLAIISPALILLLLLKISGIPLTEAHALKTKGDAYREYQRVTSAFIPWFRGDSEKK